MFEVAEVDHEINKAEFERQLEPLRNQLMAAQRAMFDGKKQGVVVVIAGVDAAGKSETVKLINTWLDPRNVRTLAFGAPTDDQRERPLLWRYWRELPPRGSIAIFFDSWYDYGLHGRAYGDLDVAELDHEVEGARRFEHMLTEEGFVVLKLWFHLSRSDQRKRLKAFEKDNPDIVINWVRDSTGWRILAWKRRPRPEGEVPTAMMAPFVPPVGVAINPDTAVVNDFAASRHTIT